MMIVQVHLVYYGISLLRIHGIAAGVRSCKELVE
jgi:hypothetical protein